MFCWCVSNIQYHNFVTFYGNILYLVHHSWNYLVSSSLISQKNSSSRRLRPKSFILIWIWCYYRNNNIPWGYSGVFVLFLGSCPATTSVFASWGHPAYWGQTSLLRVTQTKVWWLEQEHLRALFNQNPESKRPACYYHSTSGESRDVSKLLDHLLQPNSSEKI